MCKTVRLISPDSRRINKLRRRKCDYCGVIQSSLIKETLFKKAPEKIGPFNPPQSASRHANLRTPHRPKLRGYLLWQRSARKPLFTSAGYLGTYEHIQRFFEDLGSILMQREQDNIRQKRSTRLKWKLIPLVLIWRVSISYVIFCLKYTLLTVGTRRIKRILLPNIH